LTIRLSKRLQWLADRVPRGSRLADVGTDHALLPISLVETRTVSFAVATDVLPGPYRTALNNVASRGFEDAISVRLGNGLSTVAPSEVDTVVIAGMGGSTATNILKDSPAVVQTVQRLLLQPMNASGSLRRWLCEAGFGIYEEAIVADDGRYYELIAADRSTPPLRAYEPFQGIPDGFELACEFGPILLQVRDDATTSYFQKLTERLEARLSELEKGLSETAREKRELVRKQLQFLWQWASCLKREGGHD
jgi:tRNA (adenine22-N1)-methyltransferase